jgi:hypothetical protein
MQASTWKTIGMAALPVVGAAAGGGFAYWQGRKAQQHEQESLRATAKEVISPQNFGRHLPIAQQRFLELSEVAPRTMGRPHLALPLLTAAVNANAASPQYIDAIEHAANVERGLHIKGEYHAARRKRIFDMMDRGQMYAGEVGNVFKTYLAKDLPSGTALEGPGASAATKSQPAQTTPVQIAPIAPPVNYRAKTEALVKEHGEIGQQMLQTLQKSLSGESDEMIYNAMKSGIDAMPKQASAHSPEFIGDTLAINYLLANSTAEMHKLSLSYSDILKGALITAGTAALGAGMSVAAEKGYDAWQAHKQQTHLDSSFNTAMKRLEKGVAGDQYFEQVSAKLQQDPVHYKQMAREAFNVLADTSPSMARHPIIAKSFMARVIQSDGEMPREDMGMYSRVNDLSRGALPGSQRFLNAFKAFGGEASLGAAGRMLVERPFEAERKQDRLDEAAAARSHDTAMQDLRQQHAVALQDLRQQHALTLQDTRHLQEVGNADTKRLADIDMQHLKDRQQRKLEVFKHRLKGGEYPA